jgi:hypothetical protein
MADVRAASRVEAFEVVAPKGTPKAAPLEVPTIFNPAELVRVEVVIPDGVTYLAGLRILLAHAQAIPATAGSWIIANDDKIELETVGYSNSGAWSVLVYNTDIFDHTFHVRYHVADFPLTAPPDTAAPIATPLQV